MLFNWVFKTQFVTQCMKGLKKHYSVTLNLAPNVLIKLTDLKKATRYCYTFWSGNHSFPNSPFTSMIAM